MIEGSKVAEIEAVRFPDWKEALGKEALPEVRHDLFREAIIRFLRHCKSVHAPATVALIKTYLIGLESGGVDREALRWFYQASRRRRPNPDPTPHGNPDFGQHPVPRREPF